MAAQDRFQIPVDYIKAHYNPDDRLCVALIKRGDGQATIRQEFATAQAICEAKYQAHLRSANATGSDVYLSVNTIRPGTRNRTKADIDQVRHLYVDIDERGPEVVQAILGSDLPKPTTIIESSTDRFQVLWRVDGFSKDQAEAAVRNIASRFGADQQVWDSARVLRVPGFRNTKREEPFYARVVPGDRSAGVLTAKDFPPFAPVERSVGLQTRKSRAVSGHSRSEKDWAYAMSALERGVAPAEIQAHIEADRTGNKNQPHRYAERTVAKALDHFAHKRDTISRCERPIEHDNPRPLKYLSSRDLVTEDRQLRDQFASLVERHNRAPENERPEIREQMKALAERERKVRYEFLARFEPGVSQEKSPAKQEPEMGYGR